MKNRYHITKVNNKTLKTILSRTAIFSLAIWYLTGCLYAQSTIVFSENFDNATSIQPWPYYSTGWINKSTNSLQSVSGRGKVLHVNFPAGTVGTDHGLGNYRIPLDSAYKELYLSWEYFLPTYFDFGMADGHGGGKFFGGFAGGSMSVIPNIDDTEVDGWASILMFQYGYFSTYNYFKGTTYNTGGWPLGSRVTDLYKGEWRNITVRLKINDGDNANGIFEIFENGLLVYQLPNAKIVNGFHPEYLIEHIYLNSFFGGYGPEYVSPIDQYTQFDNIIAFYYPQGSPGYRAGLSETGRRLDIPKAISYHPTPPNIFVPTTYTEANGVIESHCGYFQPADHVEYAQTSTIQIAGATSININVTKFICDRGITYKGYQQILKIYEGTGSAKVLKKTFQNGINITPGSVTVNGNSATIEWQAGQGSHNGFSIQYTSNGSGSGKNFVCKSCIAKQGKGTIIPIPPPPQGTTPQAPSNMTYSNLTDQSLNLKWTDNSNNEVSFELEMTRPDLSTVTIPLGENTTTYTRNGLAGHTNYSFRVRAVNASGYSPWSAYVHITTNYALPVAPSDLVSTEQNTNSLSLKWTDNSGIEDGFKLERSTSSTSGFTEIASVPANITTYKDNALNPSTVYYYKLRAFNPAGNTAFTPVLEVSTKAADAQVIVNRAPVISNQHFQISEGSYIIGTVLSTDPDAGQGLTYTILSGNISGIFSINPNTGELRITDDKIFGVGNTTQELVIQVTDNGIDPKSATANVTVVLAGNSRIVYIDPYNSDDPLANGSIYHPYDSWNDVTWKEGHTYLQKRGTIAQQDKILIGANDIKLGAYGEGELPVIQSKTSTYLISGFEKSGITISSLDIQAANASSCIYFLGTMGDTISIDHCLLSGNESAIKVIDGAVLVAKYNRISSEQEGIFSTALHNEIVYNIFENCQSAVNIMGNEAEARLYNNVFVDNTKSVAVSYAELTLYNNIFYMKTAGQVAVDQENGLFTSDHNIYFPEQDGFIAIANRFYDRLNELQLEMNVDMNSFETDPEFNDLSGKDYSLKSTSPAINSGKNLEECFDLIGNKVPIFSKTDIGVCEYNGEIKYAPKPDELPVLTVYPNPSQGHINIFATLNETEKFSEPASLKTPELQILDISGKRIFSKFIDINNSVTFHDKLDLSGYANGLYFIVIKFTDNVLKEKLVITR